MSSVWTRHDYEGGVTIWQRLCPDCDFGLLLGPVRFCGRCGGRGFLTTEDDPTIEELTGREDESAGRPGPEREAGITPGGDRVDVSPGVAASRPAGDNVTHAMYPLAGAGIDTVLLASHDAGLRDSFDQSVTLENRDGRSVVAA